MVQYIKSLVRALLIKVKYPRNSISCSARVSLDCSLGKEVRIFSDSRIGESKIADFTYIGSKCQIERTTIGSFTSVASEVICGLASHPTHFVSTYPGFYTSKAMGAFWFANTTNFEDKKSVEIGSDVWIGTRAIILGGVVVGHGAIIGAGSVVTKSVPPYAIVGGVPARIIKYRFDENTCQKLLQTNWWNESEETLKKLSTCFTDPSKLLAHYERLFEEQAK